VSNAGIILAQMEHLLPLVAAGAEHSPEHNEKPGSIVLIKKNNLKAHRICG